MELSIVDTSALDGEKLKQAHEKYDDFVDVYGPVLTLSEFRNKCNFPLNEEFALVFYAKTAHLNDTDFIEIDRAMLQMIGFKNNFSEIKDRHGNLKLTDLRHDFSNAIKCLRKTIGFIEGTSLNDTHAHFVIEKNGKKNGYVLSHGGHNKQILWVRMRALEHFVIMANTAHSFKIREFFLDLKHIMTEYNMYQMVYRIQSRVQAQLMHKDTVISKLNEKMDHMIVQNNGLAKQNDGLAKQLDIQEKKLDTLSRIMHVESNHKVLDVKNTQKKQELVILQKKDDPETCVVLRGQKAHVNMKMKRTQDQMHIVVDC